MLDLVVFPGSAAVVEFGVIRSRLKAEVEAPELVLPAGPGQRRFIHQRRQRRRARSTQHVGRESETHPAFRQHN
jgi:hypothetical protein